MEVRYHIFYDKNEEPKFFAWDTAASQSVLYYRNYVYDIRMITKADLPLIQDLLCYLISNRSTCYEDFSSYVMWLSSVNYC